MNKLSLVGVVAGVAAGATVLVLTANIIPCGLAFNVHITADIVRIDGKQIALDKRMDANRTNLTPIEQKVLTNVLFYPDIMDILIQKEELHIQKIVRANTDTECESDCSEVAIGWNKPAVSSLYAVVDAQKAEVIHWFFDPSSEKSLA